MTPLVATELVLGLLLLAFLAIVVFVWVRRRRIAAGGPLVLGAIREQAGSRWRLGLLRFSEDSLDWFSVIGPSFAPEYRWPRADLDLSARDLDGEVPGLSDPLCVSGMETSVPDCSLAMNRESYYALRSWLEASPPGHRTHSA